MNIGDAFAVWAAATAFLLAAYRRWTGGDLVADTFRACRKACKSLGL